MNTVSRRVRRSAARLFLGAALATLMTVSAGGAASGGVVAAEPGSGPGVTARTDVFIQDIASDVGNEPHGAIYTSFFNSPDVKICPSAIVCASHTNPIVGSTSYIFVNLRNPGPYGSGTSTGTLRAYYTTSGGGANWPVHWTPIGAVSLPVSPGVTTVGVAWPNVPSLGHFCLLVRWESATDPMLFEGTTTSINTQYNNNIAWKNANTVSAGGSGTGSVRPYALANGLAVAAKYDLVFQPVGEPMQGVKLVADLGSVLFERWRQAGQPGEGIRVVGNTQVEIVDPTRARINDLVVYPTERPVIRLTFTPGQTLQKAYVLRVAQFGPIDESGAEFDVGGVDYTITPERG